MTFIMMAASSVLVFAGCEGAGSSDGKGASAKSQPYMVKSAGKFNEGYQDGLKEAQNALLDWNAADMWLWMADSQYQGGFQRGWNDGRQMARMRDHQRKQMGDREDSSMNAHRLRQQAGEKSKAPKLAEPNRPPERPASDGKE